MENKRGSRTLALAGAVALATLVGVPAASAGPNTGRISFSLGNDITTAYFFRGILQERNGFITQPWAEVGVKLYEWGEGTDSGAVSLFGGSWNSIHSEQTGHVSGPQNWYESDAYGGVKLSLFGNTEAKLSYIAYTYPNGAFPTVQEIDFGLGFDDTQWLDKFALHPSVLLAAETENTALGPNEGWYFQTGLRPSFTIIDHETYPVSLAVPVTIGLGLDNYYDLSASDDSTFGFFQGGLVFSVPLAFIPEDYGSWSAGAGASIYTFGRITKEVNQGDSPWVVGTWSISMAY